MHTYICTDIDACLSTYIFTCISMDTPKYVSLHGYVHAHIYTYTYIHTQMFIQLHPCLPSYNDIYMHTKNAFVHIYIYRFMDICACTHTYVHTHIHGDPCKLIWTPRQKLMFACTHACILTMYVHKTYIQVKHSAKKPNFRLKYLHNFQICMFPKFLDFKNFHSSRIMEI